MRYTFIILAIFALGCEEVVYQEVEKFVKKDSLIYKTDTVFIDRVFSRTDTVELHTVTTETDTFFIATIDSVFIYQTVYVYDTVTVFKVTETFRDTFPYFPGRTVYFVPDEVQPIVTEFYNECYKRGVDVFGGNLFVSLWPDSDMPPANRSSRTFNVWTNGQYVIQVKSSVPYDQYWSCLMRELAHEQLKKPYTNTPGDLMNPEFHTNIVTMSSPQALKDKYLDALFKP